MITAPGSEEPPIENPTETGKQGILLFFQNARTEQERAIEVIDSEEEEQQQPLEPDIPKPKREQDQQLTKKALASIKKQELQKEREIKKRQRAEEKKRREEQKEEERRRREKQREDQKEKREILKRQREEEKLRRDEEKKLKEEAKERSQARIGNFFKKVSDSSKNLNVTSDYDKFFLPFYAKEGVTVNQTSQFAPSRLDENKARLDSMMYTKDGGVVEWLESAQGSFKTPRTETYTAVALLQQMTSKENTNEELQDLLSLIPQKYIKFYENIRPPYMGTYSKNIILPVDDPFSTRDTGYNYDYDSDLEWVNEEDDGEGGDIDDLESGEEDEEDDEDEEASEGEFDGFLDADDGFNHSGSHKRKFIGPLVPTVLLRTNKDAMQEDDKRYFDLVSIQHLIADQPFPIDPIHYVKPQGEVRNALKVPAGDSQQDSCSSPALSPDKKKIKSLISEPKDLLKLFNEIQDSTFSLGTVAEIAQKNLPSYSKQTIKNTVKEYASRSSGKGEATRKWIVKDTKHWEYLRLACDHI